MGAVEYTSASIGGLPVTSAEMRFGDACVAYRAATVGDPSLLRAPIPGRSLMELLYRISFARAMVRIDGGYWVKTDGYRQLDPSEKGAASYSLGMIQAAIAGSELLQCDFTVHVDAVLAILGRTAAGSRPDLVGYRTRCTDH